MSGYGPGTCDCCEMEEVQVKRYDKKPTGESCPPYSLCEACELTQADTTAMHSDLGRNLRALAVVFNMLRKELIEVKKGLAELKRKD